MGHQYAKGQTSNGKDLKMGVTPPPPPPARYVSRNGLIIRELKKKKIYGKSNVAAYIKILIRQYRSECMAYHIVSTGMYYPGSEV